MAANICFVLKVFFLLPKYPWWSYKCIFLLGWRLAFVDTLSFSLLFILLLCSWWYISLVQDFLCDIDRTAVSHNSHISGLDTWKGNPFYGYFLLLVCLVVIVMNSNPRGQWWPHHKWHRGHQGDIRGQGARVVRVNIPGCLSPAHPLGVFLSRFLLLPRLPLMQSPGRTQPPGWLMLILTHFYPPFCPTLWGQKTICLFLINSNMRHGSGSINLASNVNRDPGNSAKNASRNREQIGISIIQNKRNVQNLQRKPHDWIIFGTNSMPANILHT